jgi:hypothetical protein
LVVHRRTYGTRHLGEKINTDVAAAAAIFGLIILIVQSIRHRGEPAPTGYLPGREPSPETTKTNVKTADGAGSTAGGSAAPSNSVPVDVT